MVARTPGQRLVGHGAHVEKALLRRDQLRRLGTVDRTVDVLDLHGLADHARERVQDDETGAAGRKVLLGPGGGFAADRATRRAAELGMPGQVAVDGAGQRIEAHDEAAAPLVDPKIADLGRTGAPVAIADQERDGADHLGVADLEPAQLTLLEGSRDGTGGEPVGRGPAGRCRTA